MDLCVSVTEPTNTYFTDFVFGYLGISLFVCFFSWKSELVAYSQIIPQLVICFQRFRNGHYFFYLKIMHNMVPFLCFFLRNEDADGNGIFPYTGFHILRKKPPTTTKNPKTLQNQQKNSKPPFVALKSSATVKVETRKDSEKMVWCVNISPSRVYFMFLLEISWQTCVPVGR